jgi:4-amino-4-deoxy-L-arabinose transferase-like glycosyltransferase
VNKDLVRLLFISVVVLFLHYVATTLYLYWTVWWFDIPMHFLGGVLVGSAVAYAASLRRVRVPRKGYVIAAFVIGLVWEAFELWNGDTSMRDWPDMTLDLVMDCIGGFAAYHLTNDSDRS